MAELGPMCVRDSYVMTGDQPPSCPGPQSVSEKDKPSLVLVDVKTGKTRASVNRTNELLGFSDLNSDKLVMSTQAPLAADITYRSTAPNGLNAGSTDYFLALWDVEAGKKRWEVPAMNATDPAGRDHGRFDIVAVTADRVLVLQSVGKDEKLRGYSTSDGSLQWTSAVSLTSANPGLKVSDSGKYLAVIATEETTTTLSSPFFAVLDTAAGAVVAKKDDNRDGRSDIITWAGPTTILLGDSGVVEAFAIDHGLRSVGGDVFGKGSIDAVLVSDDGLTVYVENQTKTLKALDVAAASEKWSIPLTRFFKMKAARNGKLIGVASDPLGQGTDHQIVVLDGTTGAQLKAIPGDLSDAQATSRNGHFLSNVNSTHYGRRLAAWQTVTETPLGTYDSETALPPLIMFPG